MILLTRLVVALCILSAAIHCLNGDFDQAAYVVIALIGSLDIIIRINRNLTADEPNEGDEIIPEEEIDETE